MVITKVPQLLNHQDILTDALTSGDWTVDNNKMSEQIALQQKVKNLENYQLSTYL
jgi:hypothetical protein